MTYLKFHYESHMTSTLQKFILLTLFIFITLYNMYEIYDEFLELKDSKESYAEVMFELMLILTMFGGILYFAYTLLSQHNKQTQLEKNLKKVKAQLQNSSEKLQQGKEDFQKVVQWQFDEWCLSRSEKEVGLLILKGLSIKDISIARNTKEKTVRTQASAIYEKSKLGGRHELSAWFFEDLL